MDYDTILTERRGEHDGILWVTLNRPERMNALSAQLFADLRHLFESVRADRSVRCLVITGSGRGFCAGADFSDAALFDDPTQPDGSRDLEHVRLGFRRESETFVALRRVEVPIIAAVNGPCVGAGLDLVSHCDLALASTAARFQVAYIKRGTFPDLGGFWSLPRVIGWRKAMELMTTGRFMPADEAHEAGLTNYLVDPDELQAKTMDLAQAIETGPSVAIKMTKMLAYRTQNLDFDAALDWSGTAIGMISPSFDWAEGGNSFAEKREPAFQGR